MPSLESLDNLSWAEFRIRLFAYYRIEKREWEKLRALAFKNMHGTAYAFSGKKMPSSLEQFWKLGNKVVDKDKQKLRLEALKKAKKEYLAKKKHGK